MKKIVDNMKEKIKKFVNRSHISFDEKSEDNYILILEENKEIINFYCSSFWSTIKLCEILINCNYSLKVDYQNDGSYKVFVIKETDKRIKKLIHDDLIDNEYFRSEIFM